jgi:hypothetical protein
MPRIHLLNEIVAYREVGAQSWSNYISYSLDESAGTILAESFMVYYNAQRKHESYRRRVGQQRVSYNKAPFSLRPPLRLLADIVPPQPRDTIRFSEVTAAHEAQSLNVTA